MLAQGPKVAELEAAFASFCGTNYAVALNSGTAAIHTALYSAGVGAGDEVITTPFSFIATINPILMQGAIPVLADIRAEDFNIDPAAVEAAITPRTKAIIAVDLYGQPYNYEALKSIASKHNLKLIEDACQAVGAGYGDRIAGNLGDIGCFSLYATKNIMSGEGGILTTNDPDVVSAAKSFRQHGMVGPYEYRELGYNYRMMDLQAAIAVEQLRKADSFTAARRTTAQILDEGLSGIPGLTIPKTMSGRTHVYHQYTVRIGNEFKLKRVELMAVLKEAGIGSGIYYPKPLHAYPHIAILGYKLGDFPVAEEAADEVLSLPVHPRVSEDDAKHIVETLRKIAS